MSKNIYFVRHGETDSNFDRIHRGQNAMLNERGKEQAAIVGERFTKVRIDIIVTSSYQRAIDTGEIIAKRIKKPIADKLDALVEYEHPSDTLGLPYADERHIIAKEGMRKKFLTNGKERYSNEENFPELQKRVREVLTYLENRPEEHILVVSHGRFIRFLVAYICLGDTFTPASFNNLDNTLKSSNTGITRAQLRDDKRWVIWQWNDSAHIG